MPLLLVAMPLMRLFLVASLRLMPVLLVAMHLSLSLSLALAGMTRLGVVSQRCPTATSIMFI